MHGARTIRGLGSERARIRHGIYEGGNRSLASCENAEEDEDGDDDREIRGRCAGVATGRYAGDARHGR